MLIAVVCVGLLSLSACVTSAMYETRVQSEYPPVGEFVSYKGGQLHVIEAGKGAPVLLIHGASANAREFTFTLQPELAGSDVHLMMVDRPGHGYSDRFDGAWQLGEQSKAMARVVTDKSEGPVVVVGHSFGGAVALRFALDYPELTKAVVLLAPVTHDWGEGGITWYNSAASAPVIGSAFSQLAPLVGPKIARSSLNGLFSPAPVPEGYADKLGVDLLFRPPNFRANAKDMVSLKSEIQKQQARYADEIAVPVIVFSGSYDTVIKPKLHAARLVREVPGHVVLVKLTDEGHMPHHGKATLVADTILRLSEGESVQVADFQNLAGKDDD